jgi:hypothetical protein
MAEAVQAGILGAAIAVDHTSRDLGWMEAAFDNAVAMIDTPFAVREGEAKLPVRTSEAMLAQHGDQHRRQRHGALARFRLRPPILVGGGRGVLSFQGRRYPFSVGSLSVGATIGASWAQLVSRALNLRQPSDLAGTYSALGGGVTVAGGVQSTRLQNAKGVVLELRGRRVGFDFSVGVGGATITMP